MKGFIKNLILYHGIHQGNWVISKVMKIVAKEEKKKTKMNKQMYKVIKNGK